MSKLHIALVQDSGGLITTIASPNEPGFATPKVQGKTIDDIRAEMNAIFTDSPLKHRVERAEYHFL